MDELNYKEILAKLKQLLTLQLDYSKLTLAEKLTVLLSRMLLVLVCVLCGLFVLFFLSSALVSWLTQWFPVDVANLVVAGVLLVLLLIVVALRKPLIVTPITRFVVALFFTGEQQDTSSETPNTPAKQS